jgi:hypothetical protein
MGRGAYGCVVSKVLFESCSTPHIGLRLAVSNHAYNMLLRFPMTACQF